MITLKFLFLTLLFIAVDVRQCPEDSFKKLVVEIQEKDQLRIEKVKQCISSENIPSYNSPDLQKIIITNQNIPILKKGFINNILADFRLIMSNNDIATIEAEAFLNLPRVNEIDLDHNSIDWIESNAFTGVPLLEAIDLSYNKIEQLLQNTFDNLPKLATLSLSNNNLKSFQQDSFYNLSSLEILDLNFNQLSSIPRAAFIRISSLKYLSLQNNQISYIHKLAFQGLTLLQELLLEKNRLKQLDVDFSVNPSLVTLSVENNNITYISDLSLSTLEDYLTNFWIHANPWQCSCFNKIMEWGLRNKISVSWKCKDVELFCVVPKKQPNECVERSDNDFYESFSEQFQQSCKKLRNVR